MRSKLKKYLLVLLVLPFCAHAFFDTLSDDGSDPNCYRIYKDSDEQDDCERRRKYARHEFIERVSWQIGQNIQCPIYDDMGEGLEFVFKSNVDVVSVDRKRNWEGCNTVKGNAHISYDTVTPISGGFHWKDKADRITIAGAKVFCWNSLCGNSLPSQYCETVLLYEKSYNDPVSEVFSDHYNQYIKKHIKHPYDYFEVGHGEVIEGDIREYPSCDNYRLYEGLQEFVDREKEDSWISRALAWL